ncbi:hypothetical protein ACRRTK_010366 [Alexandromys fortis]
MSSARPDDVPARQFYLQARSLCPRQNALPTRKTEITRESPAYKGCLESFENCSCQGGVLKSFEH